MGTAQFGMSYGIANYNGQIPAKAVRNILDVASQAGINYLDTAVAYGDSQKVLGDAGVSDWKIITKLPKLPQLSSSNGDVGNWVKFNVDKSLKQLGVNKIDTLFFHEPQDLLTETGISLLKAVNEFKSLGLINKIGISIYSPNELEDLIHLHPFDVVQCPYNAFDTRIVDSGWADYLNHRGIEIYARSLFLQGLLLLDLNGRPPYFKKWSSLFNRWHQYLLEYELTPLEACLNAALNEPIISKFVVGIDSADHLKEIIAVKVDNLTPNFSEKITDISLLHPSLWKLN